MLIIRKYEAIGVILVDVKRCADGIPLYRYFKNDQALIATKSIELFHCLADKTTFVVR